jgi:hypothetical protein
MPFSLRRIGFRGDAESSWGIETLGRHRANAAYFSLGILIRHNRSEGEDHLEACDLFATAL